MADRALPPAATVSVKTQSSANSVSPLSETPSTTEDSVVVSALPSISCSTSDSDLLRTELTGDPDQSDQPRTGLTDDPDQSDQLRTGLTGDPDQSDQLRTGLTGDPDQSDQPRTGLTGDPDQSDQLRTGLTGDPDQSDQPRTGLTGDPDQSDQPRTGLSGSTLEFTAAMDPSISGGMELVGEMTAQGEEYETPARHEVEKKVLQFERRGSVKATPVAFGNWDNDRGSPEVERLVPEAEEEEEVVEEEEGRLLLPAPYLSPAVVGEGGGGEVEIGRSSGGVRGGLRRDGGDREEGESGGGGGDEGEGEGETEDKPGTSTGFPYTPPLPVCYTLVYFTQFLVIFQLCYIDNI